MDNEKQISISDKFGFVLLKPGLFGAGTVTKLWAYIEGYKKALDDAGISYDSSEFDRFCDWIVERHGSLGTGYNYAEIILLSAFTDEHRALKEMKKEWTKFQQISKS